MSVAVIVTAAGSGSRLGESQPKAFVDLGGKSILDRALDGVTASGVADVVVVTAPASMLDEVQLLAPGAICVAGGATRQESVARALDALPPAVDAVLVHDAARPLTPPAVFVRVVEALTSGHRAVVPALPVADTIKVAVPSSGLERVVTTLDRTELRAIQTPQGFDRELLVRAHRSARDVATDDARLVELLEEPVWLVAGSELALKITTPHDLAIARALIAP